MTTKSALFFGLMLSSVLLVPLIGCASQRESQTKPDHAEKAPDFTLLTTFVDQQVKANSVSGAALLILDDEGSAVYEKYFGSWTPTTVVPIASASKWWAAATLMALVDDELIKLDDPLAKYLPEFRDAGKKSEITIRQCLNFTSGLPDHIPLMDDPSINLKQFSQYVVDQVDLLFDPGTQFNYGGVQMQLVARVAEMVTGKPYLSVFEAKIVRPLGLDDTRLANLRNRSPNDLVFDTDNPLVSGGVVTSVRDYLPFMRMLLADGLYDGKRILSQAAIQEILSDQTRDLPIFRTVQENEQWHYALGGWYFVQPKSGDVIVSSGGAFATNPWINVTDHYAVIFMTRSRQGQMKSFIWRLTDLVTDVMNDNAEELAHYQPEPTQQRRGGRAGFSKDQIFSFLDRDGDGGVSRAEIPDRLSGLKNGFDRLDQDKNGVLTLDEFGAQ